MKLKRSPGPEPEPGMAEFATGMPPTATVYVPFCTHPVLPETSAAYIYMDLAPLKAPLNVTATVTILERPENAAEAAPTEHWLFWSTTVELSGLESDPSALSQASVTVPWLRSRSEEHT